MDIVWYGHSCFKLSERGKASILTDPFAEEIGYGLPKWKADVVTVSHDAPGHNNLNGVKGYNRAIGDPGEYEIGGVFILGVPMNHREADPPKRNTAFLYDFDGLTVAHLGDLAYVPPQSMIEALGTVNVLLVPVGAGGGLNATQAVEIISLLEPHYAIPMHYKTPENALNLEPIDRFLKEMGVSRVLQEDTFRISGSSSLPDQTQIVLLNPTR